VTASEIAFLALGLILGAAVGAAAVEAHRFRPAPRREVRITVSPNSIRAPRSTTLASSDRQPTGTLAGDPLDERPTDAPEPDATASPPPTPAAGPSTPFPPLDSRTRVPSGPFTLPSSAVAVPVVSPASTGTAHGPRQAAPPEASGGPGSPAPGPPSLPGRSSGPDALSATALASTAVAVLDPIAPLTTEERSRVEVLPLLVPGLPATLDVGAATGVVVQPRVRAEDVPIVVPVSAVGVPIDRRGGLARGGIARLVPLAVSDQAGGGGSALGAPDQGAGPGVAGAPETGATADGTCAVERRLVDERCAVASAARDQARRTAETLREVQRQYDALRERVERAQAIADPRELRASKDAAHRAFRAARGAALTQEAVEAAARDWLTEINRLNTTGRDAARQAEGGGEELRALVPRLERLAVEADAARITAEGAEAGCHDARESLARCEEAAARAAKAALVKAAAPEPEPELLYPDPWPVEAQAAMPSPSETAVMPDEEAAIIRVLRGDRAAREKIVATLAAGDAAAGREWHLRIAQLVDAIGARAIEDGYLDLPDDDRFWGLFTSAERRDIVGALSALGFRYDGLGRFADERVPAQRDLSLAVGYAGLDRMRIRAWPREGELESLYASAIVASDEWFADEAGDLSLGRMVDALGARAGELAELWNHWGRVRPALLSTD
jgi:hypothetical protein